MRTTVTIDDDAFGTAQAYAQARGLKLGEALSELIRRGSSERLALRKSGEVWVFDLPPDTPRVSARQVRDLLDETP